MPIDSHTLIAASAPRAVYITSATEDLWADPRGEYLGGWYASPAYELFGLKGLPSPDSPPPDTMTRGDRIGYHIRTGKHDLTAFDWEKFLDFAETLGW